MKVFGERLKFLRQEKNLSKKKMSELIGFSDVAIGRWERNERVPNIDELIVLAKFFNVSTDYLCGLEN